MTRKNGRSYTTRYPKPYRLKLGMPVHVDHGGPCAGCERDGVPGVGLAGTIRGVFRGSGVTRREAEAEVFLCDDCLTRMGYDRRADAPDALLVTDTPEGDGLVEEECPICDLPQSCCICGDPGSDKPDLYIGMRFEQLRCRVFVASADAARSAPLEHKVVHSPTGFEWGYHGSGPSDLALSLLCDALGEHDPEAIPPWMYQAFKAGIVGLLPRKRWILRRDDVRKWAESVREGDQDKAFSTVHDAVPVFELLSKALP